MDDLISRVAEFIARRRLLRPSDRLVAGVSGGPDSMALLDCLRALGYSVVVAHLDHGLRPGSWEEAVQVLRRAAERGLPAVAERGDVLARAFPGGNLEEAARRTRYEFLARVALETGARIVVTGHTADDQVETVLLHLLRGSGTQGLRGMLPDQPLGGIIEVAGASQVRLVRPLLSVWRSETREFCRRNRTQVTEDPSNQDFAFWRNRVRGELIPLLESFNPQVRQAIYRGAQTTAEAHAALEDLVAEHWAEVAVQTSDCVLLRLPMLLRLPEAVQRLSLRRSLVALGAGATSDGFGAVERLQQLCVQSSPLHAQLGGGLEAWRAGDQVFLVRGPEPHWGFFPQCMPGSADRLLPGRKLRLAHGWRLTCEESGATRKLLADMRQPRRQDDTAWLDADSLTQPLRVRPWAEGDRLLPFGGKGKVKVVDLLARAHVPPPARRAWPVVTVGQEIVWVPGVRTSELCRVTASARRILHLALLPAKGQPTWRGAPCGLTED
ncbi:MAG: tRNA lysidine(34) synthetase TilS [Anaerolineales bacterium]|nr:tRNA lysidine(34) synthetase TilS [Anaerolineales bacterium]